MVLPSESLESPWSEPEMPREPAIFRLWSVVVSLIRWLPWCSLMVMLEAKMEAMFLPFGERLKSRIAKKEQLYKANWISWSCCCFWLVNKDRHPCPVFHLKVFSNVTSHRWLEASILMIWAVVYIIRRMTKSEDAETPTAERNGNLFQRRVEMGVI